ncbi:Oidioi.mRNA.OKI2018_I69.XSR.g13764.t1.cds [Oikopleura dioica]|uniref:Oidioi.mRNA.OKI2018_I69.XSR.g13764.t1.cds n=1 Tax=Oikopleura dioica TaxID=34765 RepID=A0ABN7SCK0_OIKDI|nr:Oidioi.mRNA.OKI2018_I69.XSR.g13764.t1.cds [Oikopleura dioica]
MLISLLPFLIYSIRAVVYPGPSGGELSTTTEGTEGEPREVVEWHCDFDDGYGEIQGQVIIREVEREHEQHTITTKEVEFAGDLTSTNEVVKTGKFGFHVHEKAIDEDGDCSTAGGHFSFGNQPHGPKNATTNDRHYGDLGNVDFVDGVTSFKFTDENLSLMKDDGKFFGNRSIVIHDRFDDGNSAGENLGNRVGCCNVKKSSAKSTLLNSTLLSIVVYAFLLF